MMRGFRTKPEGVYPPGAFTLIELMVVISVIGVLSSVAIPAFLRYVRRAKSSEASIAIRLVFNGAVAYYIEDHVASPTAMDMLPPQFPTTTGEFGDSTCEAGPDGAIAVPRSDGQRHLVGFQESAREVSGLTAPGNPHFRCWDALGFGIADPTYYAFAFDVRQSPDGSASIATSAYGDLDADGHLSTFSRAAEARDSVVMSASGVFIQSPLE